MDIQSLTMFCLYAFVFTQVITVTAQSTYTRKALTGSEVILPCDYDQTADGDWIIVTWTVRIGGTFQNLYVRTPGSTTNTVASPPPQFAGRMAIDGISNLRLTGVTIGDETEYRCIVTAQTLSPTTFVNLQVFQQPLTGPTVQYDPPISSMSEVPLNTTVTFTCTSTGGRPPANLGWSVTEDGTPVSVNPTYTSSNNSQGVGDATSTFNFTTTKYGTMYSAQCTASGPEPIQTQRSAITSFRTEAEPIVSTTPKGTTGEVNCSGPGVVAGAAVGCFIAGLLVGGAAVVLFLRLRTPKNGGEKKEAKDPNNRQYENVTRTDERVTLQRPGRESEEYEMVQPPSQPPQPSGDYQELRPAIYQSLQKH